MDAKKILEKINDLPTLPTVAARINAEIQSESLTAKSLGKILSEDSALTAQILRLANSAFYGMSKQVTSVEKAVTILGFNTVKNLALSVSVYAFFENGKDSMIDTMGLWRHSLGCAVTCQLLVAKTNKQLGEDAFLFGIIHDIGIVILINQQLEEMEKALKIVYDNGITLGDAEMEVFGVTHQEIGALLLQKWKFPENIVAGVRLHHNIPPKTKKLDGNTAIIIRALCIANQMVKALSLGKSIDPERQSIPQKMWKYLNISRGELPGLRANIKESYQQIIDAWDID